VSSAALSPLAALPIPDLTPYLPTIAFVVLAALVLISAAVAALAPRIVHAAFALMACFFGVAGIYALLGADFVALAQVIVYVGGILVLLVFGILLTGRLKGALGLETPTRAWPAILAGSLLFLGLALALRSSTFPGTAVQPGASQPTTAPLGRALLDPSQYLAPFELVSVLLLAALVGAAYLARRRRA
jgi:NADH:ubiquinone oxidoreductase subunit 6 (subunit J)